MTAIQKLRKLAELNFCEKCFQKYKALIEPSVKKLLFQPLIDWRYTETQITQMVMKSKGVFKTNEIIIPDKGEEEKYASMIEVNAFREVNRMKFKDKIEHLHTKGILQNSSYKLLDKARKARNKIHGDPITTGLSEQDYALFSVASIVVSQIWQAVMSNENKEFSSLLKSNAEKVAELFLSRS